MTSAEQLADVGDFVTCENGHLICEVARPIYRGMMQNPSLDWKAWRISEPERGTPVPLRCPCGAPYLKERVTFHCEGRGWV